MWRTMANPDATAVDESSSGAVSDRLHGCNRSHAGGQAHQLQRTRSHAARHRAREERCADRLPAGNQQRPRQRARRGRVRRRHAGIQGDAGVRGNDRQEAGADRHVAARPTTHRCRSSIRARCRNTSARSRSASRSARRSPRSRSTPPPSISLRSTRSSLPNCSLGEGGLTPEFVEHVAETLDIGPGTRVFEVDCGARRRFCFLSIENGYIVGGIDADPDAIKSAHRRDGRWRVSGRRRRRRSIPAMPWHVVVCRSFAGAPDLDYMRGVLARMFAKATHAIAAAGCAR